MKKTKLLTPILGAVATVTAIAPALATSCSYQESNDIIDTNVNKHQLKYLSDNSKSISIVFKGFKTKDRQAARHLSVEVINQSFSSATLEAHIGLVSEDMTEFSVYIFADIVAWSHTVTFDLKFTNDNGSFISTGYSIENKILHWENPSVVAYAKIDGKDEYFCLSDDEKINSNLFDMTGKKPIRTLKGTTISRIRFNSELIFNPDSIITMDKIIPDGFLCGCTKFNQPLDLSFAENIGQNFLAGCKSFNQPLDLTSLKSICYDAEATFNAGWFMYGCDSMVSTIKFNNHVATPAGGKTAEPLEDFLVTSNPEAPLYTHGVTIECYSESECENIDKLYPSGIIGETDKTYRKIIYKTK